MGECKHIFIYKLNEKGEKTATKICKLCGIVKTEPKCGGDNYETLYEKFHGDQRQPLSD